MAIIGKKNQAHSLEQIGINTTENVYWNLSPSDLIKHSVDKGQGMVTSTGALSVKTGEFTGRSPQDRFLVKDTKTEKTVDWNQINKAVSSSDFENLKKQIIAYLADKEIYVRDAYACADQDYKLNIRLVTEYPWSNQFGYNMFLRPNENEIESFNPEWTILNAPGFMANGGQDGVRQHNFAIVNFSEKTIIIGGTGYTGEIKKGIFSVLNYVLPQEKNVLSMHCSANIGESDDTALFFGLSGTGKTTLSADPARGLIGDDEHGWDSKGVFNFEGGCYAKTIDLTKDKEPEIWDAIKEGAILENIGFKGDSNTPDYEDTAITQNTRVSYPIYHIGNAVNPSVGGHPKNIFFLTYDAFGVLPPIAKLNKGQAMYHFISGYTSKVAGTEAGVTEPQTVFSACFGAPFLPLHPTKYAEMLGNKMDEHNANIWLVNTGLSGGLYGIGERMSLKHTRAIITAALDGSLAKSEFEQMPIFGVEIPCSCPNVPDNILNPRNTWNSVAEYDKKANELAKAFNKNFEKFENKANQEILSAAPRVRETV